MDEQTNKGTDDQTNVLTRSEGNRKELNAKELEERMKNEVKSDQNFFLKPDHLEDEQYDKHKEVGTSREERKAG